MNLRTASIGATALLALASTAMAAHTLTARHATQPSQSQRSGTVAVYPWSFQNGDATSHKTAMQTADEIARKAGYSTVPREVARSAWNNANGSKPMWGHKPTRAMLGAFAKAVGASEVLYGSVTWNSRSMWVGLGPKTISTATANVYVYDLRTNKVIYSQTRVHGRSDEKENGYKIAADILLTPLVTVVSGGPKTPHEQRAVQIALGRAYHSWVRGNVAAN